MNSTLFEGRRAERFAQLLDEPTVVGHRPPRRGQAGDRRKAYDRDLDPLVALAARLESVPLVAGTDPEFRTGLRAMLMATIERDGIGATAAPTDRTQAGRRRTHTRVAVLAGVVAGALAVSGVSAASGDAKPGDALYQVKRSTERAQLALASSDAARGQLYLEFARVRLGEASQVSPARLPQVLLNMDAETRRGVKLAAAAAVEKRNPQGLAAIERFALAQRAALTRLIDGLPPEGRARAAESVRVLDAVDARVQALRGAMACGAPAAGLDELGPMPGRCTQAVP